MIGSGMPNEYVQAMQEVRELDAFAAVVYSSHFELGVTGEANETRVGPVTEAESRADDDEILGGREEMSLKPGIERREGGGAGVLGKATEAFESAWERVIRTTGSDA